MKKKLLAGLLAAGMVASLAACGGGNGDSGTDSSGGGVGEVVGNAASAVGTAIQAQGREYGKTYELEEGEIIETAFFSCKINSAKYAEEVEDYVPDAEGNTFLILNVTVTNTFEGDDPVPMYYTDFELTSDEIGEETLYAEEKFADGQLEDEYELADGKSATGDLIYIVPRDMHNLKLKYLEYYEDDFEGNTYLLSFTPEAAQ